MRRRGFLASLGALGTLLCAQRGQAQTNESFADDRDAGNATVDPYFLDSGELPTAERDQIDAYSGYQERQLAGHADVLPRGGRPKRAPSYRFVRWDGALGDPQGRWQGALSTTPVFQAGQVYQLNAQLLAFHAASDDWRGRAPRGTLTIEMRSTVGGEPLTWLFGQQFDVAQGGSSTLALEYVGQRNGVPRPLYTDTPNIDLRIQLMRHKRRPKLLKKVLQLFSFVVGLPVGQAPVGAASMLQALPVMRVPQMVREGVLLSQAMLGALADEAPLWRSGFMTLALAAGGSRMALAPGLWVVLDENRATDLRGVTLSDAGGRLLLMRNNEPIDANYLVLDFQIAQQAPTVSFPGRGLSPAPAHRDVAPVTD